MTGQVIFPRLDLNLTGLHLDRRITLKSRLAEWTSDIQRLTAEKMLVEYLTGVTHRSRDDRDDNFVHNLFWTEVSKFNQ